MNAAQAEKFIDDITAGHLKEDGIAAVLTEMAKRGETVDEIVGVARGMRKYALPLNLPKELKVMDTCGTGGSGLPRMNISTTSSFILAAGGIKIAKHGNRSATSRCGSFDMLEKLGVQIEMSPERVSESIQKIGIGFLFTRLFHPAMKAVSGIRSKLSFPTVFNFAGPLTNPTKPAYHLLGTSGKENAEKMAMAMKSLGYEHAMVVAGEDLLDDVTLTGKTYIYEIRGEKLDQYEFKPEDVGLAKTRFEEISGGSSEENAAECLNLLQGKGRPALQALLILNAGFGFTVSGLTSSVNEGMELAHEIIKSGDANKKFLDYKTFSNS